MVSRANDEFTIWDAKTYECLKTYKEDSDIRKFIVTKNKNIITTKKDMKVSVWEISEQINTNLIIS
jgi:hypothetical protein